MILVTLGTQDKKFDRLLDAIENQINMGKIKERVVVQAGYSKDYVTSHMEILDLIPMESFDNLVQECDLLITHGGVGSIITGLKAGKKVIAAARLQKYGEHTNDHQQQIIENFTKDGYILGLEDFNRLDEVLEKAKKFKPKKFKSNTNHFRNIVKTHIDEYLNISKK